MKVVKAIVVERRSGTDLIALTTTLPTPFRDPEMQHEPLYLDFHAAQGTGAEYVRKHFGIEPEIVKEG